MGDNKIVVDHMKFEYSGIFDIDKFFHAHDNWCFERRYEKRMERNDQFDTPEGKFMELEYMHWTKYTDYIRLWFRPRIFMYNVKPVEVVKDGKPVKLVEGRVLIYLDAYVEQDYEHRWDGHPILVFTRTMFNKYFFRAWSERFERRISHQMDDLYNFYEKFFNIYKAYRPVSKWPSPIQN